MLPDYLPDAVITDVGDAILGDTTIAEEDFGYVAAALTDLALNDTHHRVAISRDIMEDVSSPTLSSVDIVALAADYYFGYYYTGD